MAEEKNALNTRDFSKVILTLDNVLIPREKLSTTPSGIDGLSEDDEADLRTLGCELIQTSGILLKLPQVAMATGQVLFQRFYYSKSFVKHTMEVVAMACVNLASKIEECPRRQRDVINVFHHIKQVRCGKTMTPLILDANYINLKNQVIKAERRILKELGFCVHVKHPHKIIVMYLQVLECERNQRFVQCAWNYMNDSFRTNVFVCYRPETIACACIYLAARQLQIALPSNPPWYGLFSADEEEIQDICYSILRLYTRPKPNPDKLEQIVNDIKKVHVEARLKAKGSIASNNATPNSRPTTPSKVDSPMAAQLKRIKTEDDRKSEQSFGKDLPKKRSHSPDSRDSSRSRSRSRSARSSHSGSRSPRAKKRMERFHTPPRHKERERTKHKYSQESNRYNRSDKLNDKYSDKYSNNDSRGDKYYYDENRYSKKDKVSNRDRDYYDGKDYKYSSKKVPSPIKYVTSRSQSYSPDSRSKKKYTKEKRRSRSRSRSDEKYESKRKSKKHANGHRRSRSRDRYKKSA